MKNKSIFRVALVSILVSAACSSMAQENETVKIGFITDLSGAYSDLDGPGGADAIRMAAEDYGGNALGRPIEILTADHQNKPDVAALKGREWFDQQNISLLIAGANSAAALALNNISADKKRILITVSAGADKLTNEACQPYGIHYAYDTVALARGTASAMVKNGDKRWYFLTADFAFGHSLEKAASSVVSNSGGTVLGAARHPAGTSDFSSFLLQAQASKPQVLGLANAGTDTINSIKAVSEFGLNKNMKVAGLLVFLSDIHSLGLPLTQGMLLTDSWYWDQNEASRKFAKKYFARNKRMPTSVQAANYSATMTYLKAVDKVKTDKVKTVNADKVMAELKSTKIDDFYTKGYIRKDGRGVHDMYLYEVKTPSESKKPWDYLKLVSTIPADQAFTTLAESKCPLVKTP
jgi:branched-chain amino acid transport system substrate-binding protein